MRAARAGGVPREAPSLFNFGGNVHSSSDSSCLSSVGSSVHGKLVSPEIGFEEKMASWVSSGPDLVPREGLEAKPPGSPISRAFSHASHRKSRAWRGLGGSGITWPSYHQASLLSPPDFLSEVKCREPCSQTVSRGNTTTLHRISKKF